MMAAKIRFNSWLFKELQILLIQEVWIVGCPMMGDRRLTLDDWCPKLEDGRRMKNV
jgi:hypothetical protein